jgi:FkbM family methyltransferase
MRLIADASTPKHLTELGLQPAIEKLFSSGSVHPILLDVGASSGPPPFWRDIARHAVHVAFDPDLREMSEAHGGPFYKSTVLNEAITANKAGDQVTFYLAAAPQCSSTLRPNYEVVSNFFGAERFEIKQEVQAKATTIDQVLDRLKLDRIDWLKLDTQGTDARLFDSIRDDVRSRLLAVDLEPGLRGAYVGEDLFGEVHRTMLQNGLWLSRAEVKGFPRMRQATLAATTSAHADLTAEVVGKAVRKTPGWIELRYLRTLESIATPLTAGRAFDRDDYLMLWAFAIIDEQYGFALDVAGEYEKRFGRDEKLAAMKDEAVARIRESYAAARRAAHKSFPSRVKGWVKRRLRRLAPGK